MFITVESSPSDPTPLLVALAFGIPLLLSLATSFLTFLRERRKRKFLEAQRIASRLERGKKPANPRGRQD